MKYLLLFLILVTLLGCDNRNPAGPDLTYVLIYDDDFTTDQGWDFQLVYNPVLGDTASAVLDDGQLVITAQGGIGVTHASAIFNFPDSLVQLCSGFDISLEFRIVNSIAYDFGECNLGLYFEHDFVNIGFSSYDLYDYYNAKLCLEYDHSENYVRILINGVEKNSEYLSGPGNISFIDIQAWTSNQMGNGYTLIRLEDFSLFRADSS